MTYATQQDLVDRFGGQEIAQLTDRTNGTVIDATVVARALGDADAEIDGYLATRYVLPLTITPAVLVRLAADIARYRLFDDRTTEAVRQRYADAVQLLKSMASGLVKLDAGVTPLTVDSAAIPVLARSRQRTFSDALLDKY